MKKLVTIILLLLVFPIIPVMAGNISKHIGEKPKKDNTIMNMRAREVGYTLPWAVQDDNINITYTIYPEPTGTAQLKVKCIVPGKQYEVDWTRVKK